MIKVFTLNKVDIEVDIRISPCGPDIQDIRIGQYSVLELFDGTELESLITDHVEDNYQSWVTEEKEDLRCVAADNKSHEQREREYFKEAA